MSRRVFTWTVVGSVLLALPTTARAQAGPSTSHVPVVSSGQMPTSTPTANETPTNAYTLGITAGAHFDDNAELGKVPRQWDLGYTLFPSIGFAETLPRLDWGVDYAPGVDISQNLLYRNQFTQKLNGHVDWLISPHGLLTAQEYYLVSTNPFAQLGGAVSPGPGISPNQGIFIPNLRRTTTLTNALYSYRFSEHSSVGIGGDFMLSKYDNTPRSGPTTTLIQSQRASAKAYYNHQLSARNSVGLQYGIQVLRFPQHDARTTTHTILVFDQVNISPHSTFSIYGGPEYSDTSNQVELSLGFIIITIPVQAQQWSGAGGIIYSWTGDRLGLSLDFSRGVSDGGALVGAVESNSGEARLSWRLSQRWSLTSSIAGANDTLLATQANQSLLAYSVRAGVTQQITRDISLDWYYARVNETGGFGSYPIGNHDLAGASLTYKLMRPIGR
jgi:hypothetical protein